MDDFNHQPNEVFEESLLTSSDHDDQSVDGSENTSHIDYEHDTQSESEQSDHNEDHSVDHSGHFVGTYIDSNAVQGLANEALNPSNTAPLPTSSDFYVRDLETQVFNLRSQISEISRQNANNDALTKRSAKLESLLAQTRTDYDSLKSEYEVKTQSYTNLVSKFQTQSSKLTELQITLSQTEQDKIKFEVEAKSSKEVELSSIKHIDLLRNELTVAYEELAKTKAELQVMPDTIADIKSKAREEALHQVLNERIMSNADGDLETDNVWKSHYISLRKEMDLLALKLEQHAPEIVALEGAYEDSLTELNKLREQQTEMEHKNLDLGTQLSSANNKIADLSALGMSNKLLVHDLRCQIIALLVDKQLSLNGNPPLTSSEREELNKNRKEITDFKHQGQLQKSITDRLRLITSVAELQSQNEALVEGCRELASHLDDSDDPASVILRTVRKTYNEKLEMAAEALESLKNKHLVCVRDLQTLRADKNKFSIEFENQNSLIKSLRSQIKELENRLDEQRARLLAAPVGANSTGNGGTTTNSNSKTNGEIAQLHAQINIAQSRFDDLNLHLDHLRSENTDLTSSNRRLTFDLGKNQEKFEFAEDTIQDLRVQVSNLSGQLDSLREQRGTWAARETAYQSEIKKLETKVEDMARESHNTANNTANNTSDAVSEHLLKLETLVSNFPGAEVQEKLKNVKSELEETTAKLNSANSEISLLTQQLEELKSKDTKLNQDLESKDSNIAELKKEIEQKVENANQQQRAADNRIEELVEQVNELEDEVTEARLEVDKVREQQTKDVEQKVEQQLKVMEEKLRTELSNEIEKKYRSELETDLTPKIRNELNEKLMPLIRSELETQLRPEVLKEVKNNAATPAPADGHENVVKVKNDNNIDIKFELPELDDKGKELKKLLVEKSSNQDVSEFVNAILRSVDPVISSLVKSKVDEIIEQETEKVRNEVTASVERRSAMKFKLLTQKNTNLEEKLRSFEPKVPEGPGDHQSDQPQSAQPQSEQPQPSKEPSDQPQPSEQPSEEPSKDPTEQPQSTSEPTGEPEQNHVEDSVDSSFHFPKQESNSEQDLPRTDTPSSSNSQFNQFGGSSSVFSGLGNFGNPNSAPNPIGAFKPLSAATSSLHTPSTSQGFFGNLPNSLTTPQTTETPKIPPSAPQSAYNPQLPHAQPPQPFRSSGLDSSNRRGPPAPLNLGSQSAFGNSKFANTNNSVFGDNRFLQSPFAANPTPSTFKPNPTASAFTPVFSSSLSSAPFNVSSLSSQGKRLNEDEEDSEAAKKRKNEEGDNDEQS